MSILKYLQSWIINTGVWLETGLEFHLPLTETPNVQAIEEMIETHVKVNFSVSIVVSPKYLKTSKTLLLNTYGIISINFVCI